MGGGGSYLDHMPMLLPNSMCSIYATTLRGRVAEAADPQMQTACFQAGRSTAQPLYCIRGLSVLGEGGRGEGHGFPRLVEGG